MIAKKGYFSACSPCPNLVDHVEQDCVQVILILS
jgi:hypothetical protein